MKRKFKPFDKVLVRDTCDNTWKIDLFENYKDKEHYPYHCLCCSYKMCIPYEGNEHLLGTTDNYEESFEPKDGDFIVTTSTEDEEWISILSSDNDGVILTYADIDSNGCVFVSEGIFCERKELKSLRLATDEEKAKFISVLHKEGLDWDVEKKKIVNYKWKPKDNGIYYSPVCYNGKGFEIEQYLWHNDYIDKAFYEKGWMFQTKEECQSLCDKLNEAIKNVK